MSQLEDDPDIFATCRSAGAGLGRRTADEHFAVGKRCTRLFDVVDVAALELRRGRATAP